MTPTMKLISFVNRSAMIAYFAASIYITTGWLTQRWLGGDMAPFFVGFVSALIFLIFLIVDLCSYEDAQKKASKPVASE